MVAGVTTVIVAAAWALRSIRTRTELALGDGLVGAARVVARSTMRRPRPSGRMGIPGWLPMAAGAEPNALAGCSPPATKRNLEPVDLAGAGGAALPKGV